MSVLSKVTRPLGKRGRVVVGPLVLAFAAQGLVLLLALSVVVIVPVFENEPDFVARKTIYLPQRELEHRMAVAAFEQVARPPTMLDRLTVSDLAPASIPALPALEMASETLPRETARFDPAALGGMAGFMGGFDDVQTEVSAFAFFGLEEEARKVVICFDISTSVKNKIERAGYTMEQVREATGDVVEQLNANTLFGFIQFARNYDLFRPYLLAATVENKRAAAAWLETEFRTDGRAASGWRRDHPNGIQSVLRAAFDLDPQPDLIIILSDGAFWRSTTSRAGERVPWAEIEADLSAYQAVLPRPVRLHFIGFQMQPEDRAAVRRLVRRSGGQLREY